MAPEVMCR
jgi:serine/threonine protein kinase